MVDTLKVYDILKATLAEPEARSVTLAIQQSDSEIRQDLKTWIAQQGFATKTNLAEAEVRLIRWMVGLTISSLIAQTAITATLVKLIR